MFVKRLIDRASKKPIYEGEGLGAEKVQPRLLFHNGIPRESKSLAYDRVQKILAVSTTDGLVKIFGDCNSQTFLDLGKAAASKSLQFVENRGLLLNVTVENHIEVWDIVTKQLMHVHMFLEEITSFTVLQQKLFIYVGDCLGNVSILKLDAEKCQLTCLPYHIPFSKSHGAVVDASYSSIVLFLLPQPMAESRRLLIIFKDGAISLWGIQESKLMFVTGGSSSTSLHNDAKEVTSACWGCPSGSKIVVGYKNGEIYIWSIPKLSETKTPTISNQKDLFNAPWAPLLKLNLIYKVNKIPVVSLRWNFADGRAPRLYINGVSDLGSSFLVVLLNKNTESRMVKLVLPLSEACLDVEIISGRDEQTKKRDSALILLLSSGQLCVYNDSDVENYLLQSQSNSLPEVPRQLKVRIPLISSSITVSKLISERPDMSAMTNKDLASLVSRIPSIFSTDSRDGKIQFAPRFGFTEAYKMYITGHQDGSINFWDVTCCLLLPILSIKHQGEDCQLSAVTALHFDIASRILISGLQNGQVTLYTFKSTQSVTDSIFSFLQVKQGCNYADSSIKFDGAILTICLNPELNSFAVGTDKGYVYAIKIEEMTILYQKQFSSELSPSIVHLQYYNCAVDGYVKNILFIALGDSSISAIEGDTGNMVGTNIIKRKKPTRALFMQISDTKFASSHQPLLLHCSEKSARLYSLSHAMQGLKKVYNKKNLHGHCCWASTFYDAPSGCGLVLIFANCMMEIRSLPELSLLKEIQLRGLMFPGLMASSNLHAALCSSSEGNLIVARGDQEIIVYSVLNNADRSLGFVDQVYKKDVADPQRPSCLANNQKEKKMGIFGTVMKDVKGIKAKEEQETVDSDVTAVELSNLFSTCNFPLLPEKGDSLTTNDSDIELDIDDIDIDEIEEKSTGQNVATLNKQLGKKFNAIKEKLKTKALKKLETSGKDVKEDEKDTGTVNEIKRRYGYSMTDETSISKLAQNKLGENLNKLQGINLKTSEMQNTAHSFSSAAKELLHIVEQKK